MKRRADTATRLRRDLRARRQARGRRPIQQGAAAFESGILKGARARRCDGLTNGSHWPVPFRR